MSAAISPRRGTWNGRASPLVEAYVLGMEWQGEQFSELPSAPRGYERASLGCAPGGDLIREMVELLNLSRLTIFADPAPYKYSDKRRHAPGPDEATKQTGTLKCGIGATSNRRQADGQSADLSDPCFNSSKATFVDV